MKKNYIMLMLLCVSIVACSHQTYYDPKSGYGRAYFDEIRRACDQSKYYCEDLIEKARLAHHRCRSTDGIKKQQRDSERVVNDTITQKYTTTEWRVPMDLMIAITSYHMTIVNMK